jgi:hypothetical protein
MNSNELNVYVINLEFRTDRRVEMQRQLARIGWSATFFPAIRPDDAGDFDTIGTRGCFLSHLGVLKHAAKQDRDMVLMEDDLTFSEDFSNLWCSAYEALQTNRWSIFYPGHLLTNAPLGLHRVNPTKGLWCAHFMVIKKENIAMLADALDTMLSLRIIPSEHRMHNWKPTFIPLCWDINGLHVQTSQSIDGMTILRHYDRQSIFCEDSRKQGIILKPMIHCDVVHSLDSRHEIKRHELMSAWGRSTFNYPHFERRVGNRRR